MIRSYLGEFGQGKTLTLTWHLINAMYAGVRVITNYPIKILYDPIFGKKKLLESECYTNGEEFRSKIETEQNCIFGCDETGIFLPPRFWNSMSEKIEFKFRLVEHFRTDIWYTVQEFGGSVKRLRDLTNSVYLCQKWNFGIMQIYSHKIYKKELFNGVPTDEKRKEYFRGMGIIWPSEARRVYKAYQRTYQFEGYEFGEFKKSK